MKDIIDQSPAKQLINDFYYQLPNNGFQNEGLLSCDKRYQEAITCALVCVDKIIESLESHSWQNRNEITDYKQIKQELIQIQNDQN